MIEKLPVDPKDINCIKTNSKINELVDAVNTLTEYNKPYAVCDDCKAQDNHLRITISCNHKPFDQVGSISKPRTKEGIMLQIRESWFDHQSFCKKQNTLELSELLQEYALLCVPKEVAVDPDNEYFLRGYNAAIEEMRKNIHNQK